MGDIVLGAVARVIADDSFVPARWAALDEAISPALGAQRVPGGRDPTLCPSPPDEPSSW